MKKTISLFFFLLLSTLINAQYSYSVSVTRKRVAPKLIPSELFFKAKVEFNNGEILEGYGNITFEQNGIRYIKDKGYYSSIISINEWKVYHGRDIKKVDFFVKNQKYSTYPIKRKGDFGLIMMLTKIYEDVNFKIYTPIRDILNDTYDTYETYDYDTDNYTEHGDFAIIKKGDNTAYNLIIGFKHPEKPLPNRVSKLFKDCKILRKKIKKKEFRKTFDGFIETLKFYEKECK